MAFVSHRRGDAAKRRAFADSARSEALAHIRRKEENIFDHSILAVMDAFLDHADDAVREGRRTLDILPLSKDAVFGIEGHVALAQVYTVLGKPDSAVQHLRSALAVPSYMSVGRLRADPFWAPLKGNPEFERLLAGK